MSRWKSAVIRLASIGKIFANKKFVLISQGRSGGTTLLSILGSHDDVMCYDEPLSKAVQDPYRLISGYAVVNALRGKAWGFKVKPWHINKVQQAGEPADFIKRLADDNWLIIHLTRRNVVRQAISSLARSRRREAALAGGEGMRVNLPPEEIKRVIERHNRQYDIERAVLRGVPRIDLVYEDDILNSNNRLRVANRLFKLMGVKELERLDVEVRTDPSDLCAIATNCEEVREVMERSGMNY